jgi:hypothetical protein
LEFRSGRKEVVNLGIDETMITYDDIIHANDR